MKKFILVVATFVAIACSSCSDSFFDDDLGPVMTKSSVSLDRYLDMDIDTIRQWSEVELGILDEAEIRMGIEYNETKRIYTKNDKSADELNLSEQLYNRIWKNYQRFNQTVLKNKRVRLLKNRNPEGGSSNLDCVVLSLSHCLNEPYETVAEKCSLYYSDWPEIGVDLGYVGMIVASLGHSMTTYYSPSEIRAAYGDGIVNINAMLCYYTGGTPAYHAVCAYKYDGSGWLTNKIFYRDYQNGGQDSWMAVSSVSCLFVF